MRKKAKRGGGLWLTTVVDDRTGKIVAWTDRIPLRYEYTAGTAGEVFLRGLKEARILAAKCTRCGEVRTPPRIYCLECGGRMRIDVEINWSGHIVAVSTAHYDANARPLPVGNSRTTFGYVAFEGVRGGLIHRILSKGRRDPRVGDPARPLFRPPNERTGSIWDLSGFRNAAARTQQGRDL